jgi:hypothetical protein
MPTALRNARLVLDGDLPAPNFDFVICTVPFDKNPAMPSSLPASPGGATQKRG